MVEAGFVKRRVVGPVVQLLRYGATPERLAWSIAVGVLIGVNPLLGSTTVVALAVAPLLGLNLVASQLGNHLVYPLQLLLFPVFIRTGSLLFGTKALPLELRALFSAVKLHPWATTQLLWSWEWHALVVWAGFSTAAVPLLKIALKPVLVRVEQGIERRGQRIEDRG